MIDDQRELGKPMAGAPHLWDLERLHASVAPGTAARYWRLRGWAGGAAAGGILATLLLLLVTFGDRMGLPGTRQGLEQPLADGANVEALYVAEMKDVAGTRVITPNGKPAVLVAGDTVLVGGSGEVLRLGRGAEFVRLRAREDQSIRLANVGMWVPETGKFGGLTAVYNGGQWRVDTQHIRAENLNSRFETGSFQDPIPGWSISPAEAEYEITRMQDNDGPFIRVRALKPSSYLAINGAAPLPDLDGLPVTVYGQIRAYRTVEQKLTVHRPGVADAGLPMADYTNRPGQWNGLSVKLPRVERPTTSDNFSLGLYDVQAGDIFDIRELSLFVGLLP